jgi:hypothetical protein
MQISTSVGVVQAMIVSPDDLLGAVIGYFRTWWSNAIKLALRLTGRKAKISVRLLAWPLITNS